MNLILFEPDEIARPLPRRDARARHVLEVLQRRVGDTFDAGLVNGPRGKATLAAIADDALTLTFAWGEPPPPLAPITLVVGLPRPQTARDILRDATSMGTAAIHFVRTEKSDPAYARSTLWSSGEWRRHAMIGAAQAFDTRLPNVTWDRALAALLETLPAAGGRLALDVYEASTPLADISFSPGDAPVIAIGPERGWGPADRALLRAHGFALVHLGARVLRGETAVIAALTLVRARLGRLR